MISNSRCSARPITTFVSNLAVTSSTLCFNSLILNHGCAVVFSFCWSQTSSVVSFRCLSRCRFGCHVPWGLLPLRQSICRGKFAGPRRSNPTRLRVFCPGPRRQLPWHQPIDLLASSLFSGAYKPTHHFLCACVCVCFQTGLTFVLHVVFSPRTSFWVINYSPHSAFVLSGPHATLVTRLTRHDSYTQESCVGMSPSRTIRRSVV